MFRVEQEIDDSETPPKKSKAGRPKGRKTKLASYDPSEVLLISREGKLGLPTPSKTFVPIAELKREIFEVTREQLIAEGIIDLRMYVEMCKDNHRRALDEGEHFASIKALDLLGQVMGYKSSALIHQNITQNTANITQAGSNMAFSGEHVQNRINEILQKIDKKGVKA